MAEHNFCRNFSLLVFRQEGPQNMSFCILFSKFCHLIFIKPVWNPTYCDTWLVTPKFMSGNILVLELLHELISTNQTGRFKSVQYPKHESRNEVVWIFCIWVTKSIGLGLAWISMPKLPHNDKWEIYSDDKIWSSFLCTWISVNRTFYEITVFDSLGESVQHFY